MTYIEQAEAEIKDLRAALAKAQERIKMLETTISAIRVIVVRHQTQPTGVRGDHGNQEETSGKDQQSSAGACRPTAHTHRPQGDHRS